MLPHLQMQHVRARHKQDGLRRATERWAHLSITPRILGFFNAYCTALHALSGCKVHKGRARREEIPGRGEGRGREERGRRLCRRATLGWAVLSTGLPTFSLSTTTPRLRCHECWKYWKASKTHPHLAIPMRRVDIGIDRASLSRTRKRTPDLDLHASVSYRDELIYLGR
ncbi:hypothetical protein GGS23DRAFT_46021 [Durotheca rogersii]|uniref:uncharacterized protein n=1 Tax=Durotheca rogersii TaxID=419775 RepID=UPI00222092CD|nr:uncharacterized protein GGS23DRAFT_46021 [Durotheca rogersii]KAI5868691.1 hypothetical protein GGS23DRAFT_46021 [Durotheca rogersii]